MNEAIITAKKSLISDFGESISGNIEKNELKKMIKTINIELPNNPRLNKMKNQIIKRKKLNRRCTFQLGINSLDDYSCIGRNRSICHDKNRINV